MRKAVQAGEERALEMVVKLFDWLDGLGSQPTTEIVYLYNMSQGIEAMIANTLAQMDQAATKKEEIDKLNDELKNHSKASLLTLILLGAHSNTLNIGYGCYLPLREHHHDGRLEAAAINHLQHDMRPSRLLF